MKSNFSKVFKAIHIASPLITVPEGSSIRKTANIFSKYGFNVIPIQNANGEMLSYYEFLTTKDFEIKNIKSSQIVSGDAPLREILEKLSNHDFIFVINQTSIENIITKADVQKQPVRMFLFSRISEFEIYINNFLYKEGIETEIIQNKLSEKRFEKLNTLFLEQIKKNEELNLLECLELCDKKTLLIKIPGLLNKITDKSHIQFERIFKSLENLRNDLAHSKKFTHRGLPKILDILTFIEKIAN